MLLWRASGAACGSPKYILIPALVASVLMAHDAPAARAQDGGLCDSLTTEQFSDVDPGDYGADYILCMKVLGMSQGRADGGYGPDLELRRDQMASFLIRLWRDVLERGCPEGEAPFTDVSRGSPHAANIDCLYYLGITTGVTTTTYGPSSKLRASQISRFLLRTYERLGNSCPALASEMEEAVTCLEALNVLPTAAEGRGDDPVTRAQMAVYVVGLWHNVSGLGLPPSPPGFGSGDAASTEALRLAVEVLAELRVAPEQRSGYDRDLFAHWSDLDGDGCDTRREVLIRDSRVQSTLDPNRICWVVSGLWYSHYDGEWVDGPSSLDIDHLVPLAEAWDSGANSWDPGRREEFANDEGALLAVTARSNRAKGASDPAGWMPSNRDFTCPYAAAWIAVKARWSLAMDQQESDFLRGLLAGECSGSTLHLRTPVLAFPVLDTPTLDTPVLDTPTLDTPGGETEVPPDPGDSMNCSDFSTQGEAQEWFDTYFPYYGDVARLDRDGDGVVCESLPAG